MQDMKKKKLDLKEGFVLDKIVMNTKDDYFSLVLRLPTMKDAARVRKCINTILGREENVRFFRTVSEKGQNHFMQETLRKMRKRRELFVVGEANKKIILIAALMRGDFRVDEHVADFVVGIMNDYRGYGIGTKIAEALFAIAPEFGITVIKSSYDAENDKVKNFYRKFGFSEIGRMPYTRNVKGKLHDEVLVVKKL